MMDSPLPSPNQDHRRVRVLIVDDMPQVRHDLRQLLELTGEMEIVGEATNGQDAIRLSAELSPDVIIMDLEMPGMDGFEAARQIKAQAYKPRIVILSIHAGMEELQRARATGADAFLIKGNSYDVLVNAILGKNVWKNPSNKGKE